MKKQFKKIFGKIQRRKKLFEATVIFIVEENDKVSLYLNRDLPSENYKGYIGKKTRVIVLNQHLHSTDLLKPNSKIGVIYWSDTYEIVKIIPMDDISLCSQRPNKQKSDNSDSSSEDEACWDQMKCNIFEKSL